MKTVCRATLLVYFVLICLTGCGGNSTSPNAPPGSGCSGVVISGTLQDSLTSQPVAQGMAVLESGTELATTAVYDFFPTQEVATDIHGGFSLCAQAAAYPSAIVLEAMDSGGEAYPPFIAPVSGTANLGTILMGGCTLTCGFLAGELQTSTPATITGVITSAPTAVAGTVVPQYAMQALDGSKATDGSPNLWAVALPVFNASPVLTFSTITGACAGVGPFCSTYTLLVPAQSPLRSVSGGTTQAAVAPTYMIYAVPGNGAVCTPTFGSSAFQPDGKSLLTATPGAQLTAESISLSGCH